MTRWPRLNPFHRKSDARPDADGLRHLVVHSHESALAGVPEVIGRWTGEVTAWFLSVERAAWLWRDHAGTWHACDAGGVRSGTWDEIVPQTTWRVCAFAGNRDLSWTRDGDAGTVIVQSDEPGAGPIRPLGAGAVPSTEQIGGSNLLWGRSDGTTTGGRWIALYSDQADPLWIPLPDAEIAAVRPARAVSLRSREYVTTDHHGNVMVSHVRRTGLHLESPRGRS